MKHFNWLYFVIFSGYLFSCKNKPDVEKEDGLATDSVSFSALAVSCVSSSANGIAVIDVKKFYLEGKEVETQTQGKLFETADEEVFTAVMQKVSEGVVENAYRSGGFNSFHDIFEAELKKKVGIRQSYDLDKNQASQLFKNQAVALRSGVGDNARLNAGASFSLKDLVGFANISTRPQSSVSYKKNYEKLSEYLTTGKIDHFRTAVNLQEGISVSSYQNRQYIGGYTFILSETGPFPGAPPFIWEEIIVYGGSDVLVSMPQGAVSKGYGLVNFSDPKTTEAAGFYNATVKGNSVILGTPGRGYAASISLKDPVNVSNGFESTFEYAGKDADLVEIRLSSEGMYRGFGIGARSYGNYEISWPGRRMIDKPAPPFFDGSTRKVKVRLFNSGPKTSVVQIFIDNMDTPLCELQNSNLHTSQFLTGNLRISLDAVNDYTKDVNLEIKSWEFRAL